MKSTAKILLALVILKATPGFAAPALLAASATSSSAGSSSLVCLIDTKCQGKWSPGSVDSGHDEGLYFQFSQPIELNFFEVTLAGNVKPGQMKLRAYLDGKTTTPKELVVMSARVTSTDTNETRFLIGARDDDYAAGRPLETQIRSLFIKLDSWGWGNTVSTTAPVVKSVRFYKDFGPGTKGNPVTLTKPLSFELPLVVTAEVSASSVLNPSFAYDASHLFDSMTDMAWATDGNKTSGVGETVTVKFASPVDVSSLMIWNGYQRSSTHFSANARVATLKVSSDVDSNEQDLTLKDISGMQTVALSKPMVGAKTLVLKIGKVYPGSKYKDVLMSEMRILNGAGRIVIPAVSPMKPQVPAKIASMIDRSYSLFLHSVRADAPKDEFIWKCESGTLRIRGNGTFVIYKDFSFEKDGGSVTAAVSEGNWEPKDSGIRVFGKKYTTSLKSPEYLKGNAKEAQAAIFQSDMSLVDYTGLSKPERLKVLKEHKARLAQKQQISGAILWDSTLKDNVKKYTNVKYTAVSEAALLEAVDADLIKRKPVVVKASVFSGIVLPTDQVTMCSTGP